MSSAATVWFIGVFFNSFWTTTELSATKAKVVRKSLLVFGCFTAFVDNKENISPDLSFKPNSKDKEEGTLTGAGGGWLSPDGEAKWGSWTPASLLSISSLPTASLEQSLLTLPANQWTGTSPSGLVREGGKGGLEGGPCRLPRGPSPPGERAKRNKLKTVNGCLSVVV